MYEYGGVPAAPEPVNATVIGASPVAGLAPASAVGSGFTVTATVALAVPPFASTAVTRAVYWPIAAYVWVGAAPLPAPPSPKSQP